MLTHTQQAAMTALFRVSARLDMPTQAVDRAIRFLELPPEMVRPSDVLRIVRTKCYDQVTEGIWEGLRGKPWHSESPTTLRRIGHDLAELEWGDLVGNPDIAQVDTVRELFEAWVRGDEWIDAQLYAHVRES